MNNLNWLIRASRWARNPPSPRMVKMVLAINAQGLAIKGLEHFGQNPDRAQMDRPRGMHLPRP